MNSKQSKVQVKHTYKVVLCEAYEVGWDFVIAPEQQQQSQQPHQNLTALHTGEGPSCYICK